MGDRGRRVPPRCYANIPGTVNHMSWTRRYLGEFQCSRVLDVATGAGRFIEDLRILMATTGNQNARIIGVTGSAALSLLRPIALGALTS